MGRRTGLCLLALLISLQASALNALVWHTVFHTVEVSSGDIGGAYIEAYWQVIPGGLHFNKDDQWRATLKTDILFRSDTGIVAEQHLEQRTAPAGSLADARQQNIIDLHRYKLPEGKITMLLQLSEPGYEGNKFVYIDSFTVAKENGTFYSGLQLLDTSYASTVMNMFSKNEHQQIPLCSNFLDDYHKVLHYYAELYQGNLLSAGEYPLIQRVFISRREYEMPVHGMMHKDSIERHTVRPVYGSFDIGVLPSGNYYLNTVLEDKKGVRIAANSYFFQRENKHPDEVKTVSPKDTMPEHIEMIDVAKTFVDKFSFPQLMAVLKMISPISDALETQTIKSFQKKPDEMYVRYFIYNFWSARNKNDPEGEWKKYADKVREVNKLFTSGATRGYETDRGIIYLKYGKPDERIPVENEAGTLPYEIWEYRNAGKLNQEGVFLFYRPPEMINDYRLLHSTVNGETRNADWRNYLYKLSGSGSSNLNSRAEQYIRNR